MLAWPTPRVERDVAFNPVIFAIRTQQSLIVTAKNLQWFTKIAFFVNRKRMLFILFYHIQSLLSSRRHKSRLLSSNYSQKLYD